MATNENEIEINSQHSPTNDKRTVGDFLNISRGSGEKAKHFLREILDFNISDLPEVIDECNLIDACKNDTRLIKVEKLLKEGKFLKPANQDDEEHLVIDSDLYLKCSQEDRWDLIFFLIARAIQLEYHYHYFYILHISFGQLCYKDQVILGGLLINCAAIDLNAVWWDYSLDGEIYESTRPNVNLVDTFLHSCSLSGSTHMMEKIIEKNPSLIEEKNSFGNTPLHVSCLAGFASCAKILLDNRADINAVNKKGQTPLHIAAQSSSEEMLYLLISKMNDVNCVDYHHRTPLFAAAYSGNSVAVTILIKHGAVVDWRNDHLGTPLISAIQRGHEQTVKVLLDLGASTDVRNKEGKSPSDIAIEKMQDSSLALIIRKLRGSGDFSILPWSKIINCQMKKSIYSMLDCFIESSPIYNEVTVTAETLDSSQGEGQPTNFQLIAESEDEDLAYHGVMRLYVDREMEKRGTHYLYFKTFLHSLYLIAMGYALYQAATQHNSVSTLYCSNCHYNFFDGLRIIAEIYVLLFWITFFLSEMAEFQLLLQWEERKNKSLIEKIINWFASLLGKSFKFQSANSSQVDPAQGQDQDRSVREGAIENSENGIPLIQSVSIKNISAESSDSQGRGRSTTPAETGRDVDSRKFKSLDDIYTRLANDRDNKIEEEEEVRKPIKTNKECVEDNKVSLIKSLKEWGNTLCLSLKIYGYFLLKLFYTIYHRRDNLGWAVVKYFSDGFNWLDIGSLLSLFVLIILRVLTLIAPQLPGLEFQWYVATLTFLLNSLSIVKLLNIYPVFGTYIRTIILVFKKDVSKFILLFVLTLFIFVITFILSIRVPLPIYNNETNGTTLFINYFNTSQDLGGIAQNFGYLLIFGTRILLDEEVFNFPYSTTLNFLAVITYMVFVFIIIVLYLNILIAQLTDTYGSVKINAEKLVAGYRMNFVYQIQKKSVLSFVEKHKSDDEGTEEYDKFIVKEHEFKKYFIVENIFEIDSSYEYGKGKDLYALVDKYTKEHKINLAELEKTLQKLKNLPAEFSHLIPNEQII